MATKYSDEFKNEALALARETSILGDNTDRNRSAAHEHTVAVPGLGCKLLHEGAQSFGFSLFHLKPLEQRKGEFLTAKSTSSVSSVRLCPMPAECGENIVHNPCLEADSAGQLGANNQAIEITLGDKILYNRLAGILRMR